MQHNVTIHYDVCTMAGSWLLKYDYKVQTEYIDRVYLIYQREKTSTTCWTFQKVLCAEADWVDFVLWAEVTEDSRWETRTVL